jgi:DNA-binding SARP family transcriptional activator
VWLALLGPLDVVDDAGRRRVVVGARPRVLLAALALRANEPVSGDALAEAVWDGVPPPGYIQTLRSHLKRVRGAVGPQAAARIVAHTPGYRIELGEGELDLGEFERLCQEAGTALRAGTWEKSVHAAERALGLWRGEPLADIPSQVLREACVPHFDQLRAQVHEDHVEAQLQLGRHRQAASQLRELTARYPLRERFHAQLMLALAGTGRRAEALTAYQDARTVLVRELGIDPGPELRALQERILAGDEPVAASDPQPVVRSIQMTRAPWQLPAASWPHTGRDRELHALVDMVRETHGAGGVVVICGARGMSGIGKTALAVHAAHRLAEEFPDGRLFLDLHGHVQGHPPRETRDALAWLLRALGTPAPRIPGNTEARAALYRERLADTRTLIVLDDAADAAQVRGLLPGASGCSVLITSRAGLPGLDGARHLSLGLLPIEDAVRLLRDAADPGRIPHGDAQLGEVARLCGYLPLAVRIAGAVLRRHPVWSPEHLIGLLRDQRRRSAHASGGERDFGAVFNLSYAALPEPHRLLLRRLGLVPGPDTDPYAAAALVGCAPENAAGLLEDLLGHGLVDARAPGRYRLHDPIRVHARGLAATDAGHATALERLLHYYAYTAQSASISIARQPRHRPEGATPDHLPVLSDPEAARDWLRAERANLEAALAHADTSGLQRRAVELSAGLAEILLSDGPFTRALEVHRAAAGTAEHHAHPAARATALTDLGRACSLNADYSGASEAYTCAVEIHHSLGNRQGEAYVLAELGRTRTLAGDYAGAGDALVRALDLCRVLGDRGGEATASADLGRARYLAGDHAGAANVLARALDSCRVLGDRGGEAAASADLGRALYLAGDYAGAGDALGRALDLCRVLGHHSGEAATLIDLGRVRYLEKDYSAAADALTRALEIYRVIGNRDGEAYVLTDLGRLRTLTGDDSGADDAYERALEIYRVVGNRSNEAWALAHFAATLAATGHRSRALALYRQALAMNRELDTFDDQAVTLEGLGECQLAVGDTTDGIAHLQQALEMYRHLGMAPDTDRVRIRLASLTTP